MTNEVDREITRYLMRVASYLGSENMVDEITMELRTHIEDRAQELAGTREVRVEDIWRAANELGDPKEIAQGYLQETQPVNKIFISDDLYPYFLRSIAVICVVAVVMGLICALFSNSGNGGITNSILRVEITILASVGIIFVAFIFLSREGYTYESLKWKVETFFDARKVDIHGIGDRYRTRQEQKQEEKRVRQVWKKQREEEHRMAQIKKQEEKRWEKNVKRQRKWERSVRTGQLGELIGAFIMVAIALFCLSPYMKELIGVRQYVDAQVISILKQTFYDELLYVMVFLLIVSAMIRFATFVMGKTQSLYVARVGSALMELSFVVYLITNIRYYFYELHAFGENLPIADYDAMAVFFGIAVLFKLFHIVINAYRAASYPRTVTA